MASLVLSVTSVSSGLSPLGLDHFCAEMNASQMLHEGWEIVKVDHYKEKTTVGHEFHALTVHRGTEEIVLRLERRPGVQAAGKSSSSELVTNDTICRLDLHDFRPSDYYHISTTVCEEHPAFMLLNMCDICAFLMRVAPTYSVSRATHCFWFCAAFLIQVRKREYSVRPIRNGAEYSRRGRFSVFNALTEEYVEKMLDEPTAGALRPKSVIHHLFQKGSYILFPTDTHAWRPAKAELKGHTALVKSVCFTPSGRYILSGSSDKNIRLWDAAGGTLVHRFPGGHSGLVYSLSVSPDELKFVSSSSDKTMRIWNLNARVHIGNPLQGHTGSVSSVAFSPDGSRIVSGSFDGSMLIWDVANATVVGQPLQAQEADGRDGPSQADITCGAAGTDSPSRAGEPDEAGDLEGSGGTDRAGGANQKVLDVRVMSVAWSKDGRRIVSGHGDGTIRLWDALSGTPLRKPLRGHETSVTAVVFSPHGWRIASASQDKTVRLWSTASGGELLDAPFRGHTGVVHCVAFSPDGRWLASGSADLTVRVWDCFADQKEGRVDRLETGSPVWSVAWSPKDQIAAGCHDGRVRTWTRT